MTVVDTDVLLDIFTADKRFGPNSKAIINRSKELVICPISYIELSPAFLGRTKLQEPFLAQLRINWQEDLIWAAYLQAHEIWNRFIPHLVVARLFADCWDDWKPSSPWG
jgi:predicted nucleic acid-binding protein